MARVVVIGLASDFGCQVQMTNMEDDLLDVLGTIDLSYWQLASSGHMPASYDIAVVEGAVTTVEHVELLKQLRSTAATVLTIGACAVTGGIPGLASAGSLEKRFDRVYGNGGDTVAPGRISPLPVDEVIEVDYHVPGCPIQPHEFVATLQRALMGLSDRPPREPLCASCKMAENVCFYDQGRVCLGLMTRSGCGAKCVSLGRPCTGCRGIADDANLEAAQDLLARRGMRVEDLTDALTLYNSLSEALS
ncbi:MAG TPA: NADH:ubiquinone oxidoreductase [Coriobacteriia bacterium]|nr:NADH:ubiquinone oxidoreductase [Coriobacteriia bacterium]